MWRSNRNIVLTGASLLLLLGGTQTWANETDPDRLNALEAEIGSRVERQQALEAEARALAEEIAEIRRKLIETAARVQARERDVTDSETRLEGLAAAEAVLLARLETRRGELIDTLAALQRLDRNPPPALAVKPDDAVSAMRSALLLSTIVPELEAQAAEIRRRLAELDAVREDILQERITFDTASLELADERTELDELLAAKLTAEADARRAAEQEAQALARLSREASDLQDLIERLEARARRHRPVPRPALPDRTITPPALQEPAETRMAALAPSRLFSASRGVIRLPVEGVLTRQFGVDDGIGGTTRGIRLETRAGSTLTAPFDGKVAFAGPFRQYGQLIILEVGEGYHLLMAGMSRIDTILGQNVLAGEPIGAMGGLENGTDSSTSAIEALFGGENGQDQPDNRKPVLYIELRRNGSPVDPRPWFADTDRKARG